MMTGVTNFIVAAYIVTAVVLGGYSFGLVHRLRREREYIRSREARRAESAKPGAERP